jgi:hypothetical protein
VVWTVVGLRSGLSGLAAARREGVDAEGVHGGHVSDADALGHGQEDVPLGTRAGGGAIGRCSGAVGEAWGAAKGGLKCGDNARRAQNP